MHKLENMDRTGHEMNARLIRMEERWSYVDHRLNNLEQIKNAMERVRDREK